jgi:hypothetical protein
MRKSLLRLAGLAGLALLLSSPAVVSQDQADRRPPTRSFTTTADPAKPVVTMKSIGGLSGYRGTYTLYGDGRYVGEVYHRSGDLLRRLETTLSLEELHEVVAIAVDHGLMDTEDSEIEAKKRTLVLQDPDFSRGRVSIADEGRIFLSVHLETYTRDGTISEDLTKTFQPKNVLINDRLFPEIEEYSGLAQLTRRLNSIAAQAKEQTSEEHQ